MWRSNGSIVGTAAQRERQKGSEESEGNGEPRPCARQARMPRSVGMVNSSRRLAASLYDAYTASLRREGDTPSRYRIYVRLISLLAPPPRPCLTSSLEPQPISSIFSRQQNRRNNRFSIRLRHRPRRVRLLAETRQCSGDDSVKADKQSRARCPNDYTKHRRAPPFLGPALISSWTHVADCRTLEAVYFFWFCYYCCYCYDYDY